MRTLMRLAHTVQQSTLERRPGTGTNSDLSRVVWHLKQKRVGSWVSVIRTDPLA